MQAGKKKKAPESRRIDLQELQEEGERHFIYHQWSAALEKFSQILDLSPDHDRAFTRVKEIYSLRGDINQLSDLLARGARHLISLKKYSEAVRILENLLRIKPDNYLARLMISEINREEGKWEEAFSGFINWGKIFKKKDMPEEALLFLQNAYEMMPHNLEIAREIAEVILKIKDPRYASQFYRKLSIECLNKKLVREARTTLNTCVTLSNPEHNKMTIDTIYFNAGEFSELAVPLTGMLRIDFDEMKALKKWGDLLISKRKCAEAIEVYEKLLEMHPAGLEVKVKLGDLHIMIRDADRGIAYLLQAAEAHLVLNEKEKARTLYKRVRDLVPACEEAKIRLEEMGEE
jgi:tetratricopeptide (TPR) repeat protein